MLSPEIFKALLQQLPSLLLGKAGCGSSSMATWKLCYWNIHIWMFLWYKETDIVQLFATPAPLLRHKAGEPSCSGWLRHGEFLRAGWALPDHAPPSAGLSMFSSTHQCLCYASLLLWIIALINPPGHCSCGLFTAETIALELQHHPKTHRPLQTPAGLDSFSFSLLSAPSGSLNFRAMSFKASNTRHRSVSSREQDNQCSTFKMFLFLSYSSYKWRKT